MKLLPSLLLLLLAAPLSAQPPNILLILADDLGWGDVGFNGGKEARTPNLDRLAAGGMVFTDFHSNGATCTPTRAALMTGRYQQRSGMVNALFVGEERQKGCGLVPQETLIPEALAPAGYRSAILGKWHLGGDAGAHPLRQGFHEFIGNIEGHIDYISKWNRKFADWNRGFEKFEEPGYATHLLTKHAIETIAASQAGDPAGRKPFFIYLAHACPHTPHMLPGDPPMYGTDQPKETKQPEKYIPMIAEMDKGIGDIVAKIEELGIEKNTLVLFLSDNGPSPEAGPHGSAGPYRGFKGDLYEGGHRVPFLAWWPGTIPPGTKSDATAMTIDLLPTFLDLAGLPAPADRPLDGTSLKPVLLGGGALPPRTIFWQNGRGQAVRDGNLKLFVSRGREGRAVELFDLAADPSEKRDLAAERPETVSALQSKLAAWENDVAEGAVKQPAY
jgi:arylsulfatase A-like enzyme